MSLVSYSVNFCSVVNPIKSTELQTTNSENIKSIESLKANLETVMAEVREEIKTITEGPDLIHRLRFQSHNTLTKVYQSLSDISQKMMLHAASIDDRVADFDWF